jgi:Putative prokaryotic signal transducing protein
MDSNEEVVVTVVSGESEADVVCGLLRSSGIDCSYRETEAVDSLLEEFTPAGPREILVHPSDLDAARELLARSTS